MLLVVDNYDSFTFNLVQYLGEMDVVQKVVRNDDASAAELLALKPERILVSPGPCSPTEAGCSVELIRLAGEARVPLFGVCLGMQSMGEAYGGEIIRAQALMHGKTSPIHHEGSDVFAGLPTPFAATRYHSLAVKRETLPDCLAVTAWTEDGEIMGLRHCELPQWGVQFHPESLATEHGHDLLRNFLALS